MFSVDGVTYDVDAVFLGEGSIKRKFTVLDGENAGRLLNGSMTRDIIGTYYNYSLTIDTNKLSPEEYDNLYEVLSAPTESHTFTFPYGQSELKFDGYISSGSDTLKYVRNGVIYWGDFTIEVVCMEPIRKP